MSDYAAVFNARMLRHHVKLHELGMRHSHMSVKQLKGLVTLITGKKYGRNAYAEMLTDLEAYIKENEG